MDDFYSLKMSSTGNRILDTPFSLDLNEFQDFLAEKNPIVLDDCISN